jgi:hypothetical protein
MVQNATIDEAMFSVSSTPSSCGTTRLCNPFLGNSSVNTFPYIETRYKSSDVINNRDGVFPWGLCRVLIREVNAEASSVQGSYESVVSWRSESRRIFSSEVPE